MAKTATDLKEAGWPEEEMRKYDPWKHLKRHKRDPAMRLRRERALKVARRAARILKMEFEADRVVIFGSLAHNAWFTPRSDIDIYVEGIPAGLFFKAEAAIENIDPEFRIDLIHEEECTGVMLKKIDEEGLEL